MDAQTIENLANEANYEFRRYSGRGMYGKQCPAIISDDGVLGTMGCIVEGCDTVEDAAWLLSHARTDNMGRVIYWPSIRIEDDEKAA